MHSLVNEINPSLQNSKARKSKMLMPFCCSFTPLRGAELFEAKVKKLVAARLELEQKSVETLKKQ